MRQEDYLLLSEDGKSVIGCRKDFDGAVVIPQGVTIIGKWAFYDCTSLTSIKIPDSVTAIEIYPFLGDSNLKEIIVDEENPNYCSKDGVLYSKDMSILIFFPGGKESIEIPKSVTKIVLGAFAECESLSTIEIPDSVNIIGGGAFYGCTSLTSIKIPNSVTKIEDCAFEGCTSLSSIKLPDRVTEIGRMAFSGCTSLTSIKIPDSVTKIGEEAFKGCTSLKELHLRHEKLNLLAQTMHNLDLSKITIYEPKGTSLFQRILLFFKSLR